VIAFRGKRTGPPDSLATVTEMIETPHPSRRALFSGAGAVGAAALLAACSDDPTPSTTGGSTPAADPTSAPANSPAASPPGGGGGAEVVAKVSEVPVGGGKVVADKGVVVTQPKAGTFKGFSSTCTHMQCPVADVSGGTINCNCHFSKYSITDGSVVSPPAPRALPAVAIKVNGDNIELA
jgi:Rieske Fe-S protein